MTDHDGGRFTYTHDVAGRLVGINNSKGERTTLAYDKLDRLVRMELSNGAVTTQTYDPDGRLTRVINARGDGSLVSRFTYTYDCVGNRTGLVQFDGTDTARTTWTYDGTYQLTGEHRSGPHAFDLSYVYLCPCQLEFAELVRVCLAVRIMRGWGGRGTGRWSLSHRSMAA